MVDPIGMGRFRYAIQGVTSGLINSMRKTMEVQDGEIIFAANEAETVVFNYRSFLFLSSDLRPSPGKLTPDFNLV